MALNLGGGTRWETSRTLRYYLDKYHQFDASGGSLGMDDTYGGRVEAFRTAVESHLERGLWCRVHFHYIGDGLSSSEANFRAALDIARQHQDRLWIAGMADIYKYQTERSTAKLTLVQSDPKGLTFRLDCATDAMLYDQPLSIELSAPPQWRRSLIAVQNKDGASISTERTESTESGLLQFEVSPQPGVYQILAR